MSKDKSKQFEINQSWSNITAKFKALKQQRKELYKKLNKKNDFETYVQIVKEISRINYHMEVVKNLTTDSALLERAKKISYAEYSTK